MAVVATERPEANAVPLRQDPTDPVRCVAMEEHLDATLCQQGAEV